MNDKKYHDISTTQGKTEMKHMEAGKENRTENSPALIGAGDSSIQRISLQKPQRSPSEAPRPPPRTKSKRTRAQSTPPSRPLLPCRKEGNGLIRQSYKRPPYNPQLNPFKDDMEEEIVENKEGQSESCPGMTSHDEKGKKTRDHEKSLNPFTEGSDVQEDKNTPREYPESLNPFAGDTDEEEEHRTINYDESLNPFAPPPRPPPPVIKRCPQPTVKGPPVIATSFRNTVRQFFFNKDKKRTTRTSHKGNQQAMKWICVRPVKEALPDHLCLKKGQKVKQTGPVNANGYAYGYVKKGILKTKVRGFFPLACVNPVQSM